MMTERLRSSAIWAMLLLVAAGAGAQPAALVRVERETPEDRNLLLATGVPLVAELSDCFLALGEPREIEAAARARGLRSTVLAPHDPTARYAVAGLLPGWTAGEMALCGELLWQEEDWALLRAPAFDGLPCAANPHWRLYLLPPTPLAPTREPPAWVDSETGQIPPLIPDPLVQEMVDSATNALVLDSWDGIIGAAGTRYSSHSGCFDAAALVHDTFSGLGLETEYHDYSTSYAPNVVARIPGRVNPEEIYVAVGHLDDMPPPPNPAPGADDNASGAAMVVSLARVMADYAFAKTVTFLAVTGEEQGLVGSRAWAAEAAARGDSVVAALNGDMIGWEGDGQPAQENLDVNTNGNSDWLGALLAQAADEYGTGCPVDWFSCPGMVYSDHAAFWEQGWSSVCGITDNGGSCGHGGFNPNYHTSNDTRDTCGDPSFYISAVRAYLATLAHLAEPLCRRPQPPAGLVALPDGDNRIALSWSPSPDAASYEVWRAPGGCGPEEGFYLVDETTSTSYVDTTASGGVLYGYEVRAKDPTGFCRSHPGPCEEAMTTGECLEPPLFEGVEAVVDEEGVECGLSVSWQQPSEIFCGSGARFNVYRDTDPDLVPGPLNLLASCVAGTSYSDHAVEEGVPYYYVVRAEDDTSGHGGPCGGNEDRNTVQGTAAAGGPRVELFTDGFESGLDQWLAESPWAAVPGTAHGGSWSAFSGNQSGTCAALQQVDAVGLPPDRPASLAFWTSYEVESSYDGVQVQISSDGGASWQLLTPEGGYPGTASASCSKKIGNAVFNGSRPDWTRWSVDLAPWAGQEVSIRFVMASDGSVNEGGLYLDDVELEFQESCEPGSSLIFADGFESGDTSAWSETVGSP